ncbi:MAG: ABC transporter ATP-binding protein [Anaerolineaceae bacterium]|nr:ABC transporter ATP-binding protein [Anaerolineaceae bacterium]
MIIAEELTKRFDNFLAVDRVSLDVQAGQVLVLLGQNGAGKTTTVRMLTSILQPSSGWAQVCGYDVVHQADKVRASVGVLTENHGLYGRMRPDEYLEFFASLYGLNIPQVRPRIADLLDRFGLGDARKKRLGEFSKGMRQKLALVRAILHNPPVLLLDEPTSAMDPESARLVRDSIQSLRSSGRTILLCTHNLAEAEELADQVAIIHQGRILLKDSLAQVKLNLLGPAEYEARLASAVNGWDPRLPQGIELRARGENWLHFRIADPQALIPLLLRRLLDDQLAVISFQEIPRSLEQAFLQAVGSSQGETHAS